MSLLSPIESPSEPPSEPMPLSRRAPAGLAAALAIALGAGLAGPASAEPGGLMVELNKLEAEEAGCRPYLVFENRTGLAFSSLKLDLVMFDKEGIIARRLAVEAAPLPKGKTSVKVFELDGLACEGIGRILLNGLATCAAGDVQPDDCLDLIETRSQVSAPFIE